MDYLEWNNLIAQHFFNGERRGRRVFLFVTEDLLNEIGANKNLDKRDFLDAVKAGAPWNTRQGRGICQQALQSYDNWRMRDLDYPPYIGYLSLFVWAGSIDAGFAKHAYYPGLRSLLAETVEPGMYPSFNKMHLLWEDLAVWSNIDSNGDLGTFNADIVGEWMHVGLPKAQTLLTDRERDLLPLIFASNSLDPQSPPSELELIYLLIHDRNHNLGNRTKHILLSDNESDSAIRTALLDVLMEELEHWDNTLTTDATPAEHPRPSSLTLRLIMAMDPVAKTAKFGLRCRSNRPYPPEGLSWQDQSIDPLSCSEDWQGWSTPLYYADANKGRFDASTIDWTSRFSLHDSEHNWSAVLSNRPVRIMIKASSYGFDGFIEENHLSQAQEVHLLVSSTFAEHVISWGNSSCKGFNEIRGLVGLPARWRLFKIERIGSDAHIRNLFPFLAFPSSVHIKFHGGIKIQGNQYFNFALPKVELSGQGSMSTLACNQVLLIPNNTTGLYSIPNQPGSRQVAIEVFDNGTCIRKKTLYALETFQRRDAIQPEKLDRFGQRATFETRECNFGAFIETENAFPDFQYEKSLPPHVDRRIFYIGKRLGEIIEYPKDAFPENWEPVWAVAVKRTGGTVNYCGCVPSNELPIRTTSQNRKQVRLWREIVWYQRKRISNPRNQTLNTLWKKYKQLAKNV